jgi:type IV pilus assembly protein PilY1
MKLVAKPIQLLLPVLLGVSTVAQAVPNNLSIPHAPLTVLSDRVDPNVVLVIDNSGSMEHIVWHDDYDHSGSYDSWSYSTRSCSSNNTVCDVTFQRNPSWFWLNWFWLNRKTLTLPYPLGYSNTRYEANYYNYLFSTFADGDQLHDGSVIPNETRIQVARQVAINVINENPDIRFGAFKFAYDQGGILVGECTSDPDKLKQLKDNIALLKAKTWTPLAETLYDVTRYLRAVGPYSRYTSPIQYRCQKNFAIVITDGLPAYDKDVEHNSYDTYSEYPNKRLPNWDGINNDRPLGNADESIEGSYLYLDDVALFGYEIDMKKGGNDAAGVSWDDPNYARQNMYTYTIGFTVDNEMLADAAKYGNGLYMTASNTEQLKAALKTALADISDKVLSSSSSAASSGSLSDADLFFPEYNSQYWTGELIKERPDGTVEWRASDKIPAWGQRNIIYSSNGTGKPFRWDQLNSAEQSMLQNENILRYIRGDRSNEGTDTTQLRRREKLLGDIIYSSPRFVGAPSFRYPSTLESTPYTDFQDTWKNRRGMVYVGANDGMLHAFDADTGQEKLAFIPGSVFKNLSYLSSQVYEHRYYVDGTPTIIDAFIKNQWRTVLVGGLNRGGQSVYALDVTDPSRFSEARASDLVLWEFTDPDLGYSYSRPAIVKLQNGTWAAVFGNGYNSTDPNFDDKVSATGNAVLFVVDLADGSLIAKIDTGVGFDDDPTGLGRPNGLGTVAPVDHDGDNLVDYVYAGDLFGNIWKFDLSRRNPNNANSNLKMEVAFNGNPLFTACRGTGTSCTRQPIMVAPSAAPTVGRHPKGGFLVYFGTGKYLETEDKSASSTDIQSFYAIWDKDERGNSTPVSGRDQLLKQNIVYEGTQTVAGQTATVRVTSKKTPNWSTHLGWYMDFDHISSHGERVVTTPVLRNGKIIIATTVPVIQEDPCRSDSESWLMDLNALTGSALDYSSFDLNKDRRFDSGDWVTYSGGRGVASGIKFDHEIPMPTILADDENSEVKVLTREVRIQENPGPGYEGRQSWREIMDVN